MDFKEYLKTQKEFQLSALAVLMWPKNNAASIYLSKKLNGLDGREFTPKDERLARAALKELGISLVAIAKKK